MARRAAIRLLAALDTGNAAAPPAPSRHRSTAAALSYATLSSTVPPPPSTARRRRHEHHRPAAPLCLLARRLFAATSATGTGASQPRRPPPPRPATLKAALRILYRRVHPDVMTGAPVLERDRNERSLKLLSEYLAAARALGGGGGRDGGGRGGGGDDGDDPWASSVPPSTHTLPFRFVFFVPMDEEEETGEKEDEDEEQESSPPPQQPPRPLRKVELTLPPPERGRGPRGALSPASRRALRRLLSACGVPEPPPDAADDERLQQQRQRHEGEEEEGGGATTAGLEPGQGLAEWLPLAAEAARRGIGSGGVGGGGIGGGGGGLAGPDPAVRVANLRGALRLSRGLIVGFDPGLRAAALPPARQAALLQALIAVLRREDAAALAAEEEAGEGGGGGGGALDLRGLQVMFFSGRGGGGGGSSGVDGAGTVWLDASEAEAIEASLLHQQQQQEQQQREAAAAAAAGKARPPAAAAAAAPLASPAQLAAAEEAIESWADLLAGLDADHARALRAAAASARALEAAVARAVGVAAVVPAAGVAFAGGGGISPRYRAFLERLAAHASAGGPVQAPLSDVPLVVVAEEEEAASSSPSAAAVCVPLSATPEQAYALLMSRGPAAAAGRRGQDEARRARADRDERARRALGLRRLLRDPALPEARADEGVARLLQLRGDGGGGGGAGGAGWAPALAACCEGLSLRVSDACRLPGAPGSDGSADVIDVAWNARL